MTDRELLERAAKSAGFEYRYDSGFRVVCYGITGMQQLETWNPLLDDGDALRLKVKLHLVVGSYSTYSSVSGTYTADGFGHHETRGDPCAAERLAITRCAAAIGRAAAAIAVG